MFAKLFAEGGLSLDRLRALLEVNAAGSIVKAAAGDPVRQSQFSRQIKELEDFFQTKLVERQGKGIRLTANGKELARISRFFLLGLSNFRRGCVAEEQTFRIGASATVIEHFILPTLADVRRSKPGPRYAVESVADDEVERRLHDLTLDFGIVTNTELSRPLQMKVVGAWRLFLWTPRTLFSNDRRVLVELKAGRLPLVVPANEMPLMPTMTEYRPQLVCNSFLEAQAVLGTDSLGTFLPDFLKPERYETSFIRTNVSGVTTKPFHYRFAWNPRLLRLNPHAIQARDALIAALTKRMRPENSTA